MSARRHIIPVFVPHAGCPNECVFCNQKRISGSLSPAVAEDVAAAVEMAEERVPGMEGAELAFYGGSFTAIPDAQQESLLGAAQPYMERGVISSIRLSTRPDAIDSSVLERLKRFGVETVELGSQSMCDEVLRLSGRGHTADDTRHAAAMIKAAGFKLILQMMTGLPGSDQGRDIYTARELASLRPDGVRIYPTVIVRDTRLYDMWQDGEYAEHTLEAAAEVCSKIVPIFERAGIPVIRLGLNPTDELSGGSAAAGAYHPALGEIVRSRIMLENARSVLRGIEPGSRAVLGVRPGRISAMVGQHRCNIEALKAEFLLTSLKITAFETENDEVFLLSVAKN